MGLHFLAFWPCVGLHFLSFWRFRGRLLGPPTSCQKWPVCPTSLQWIYQRRDRPHVAVFSILGLHFLAFWPCGPSFPCILALWALISLHFGLVGFHFLAFWPCGSELVGPPPTSCQKRSVFPMSHIKNLAAPGPASFSNFWPFGPSFPFILAFWAFILHLAVAWWKQPWWVFLCVCKYALCLYNFNALPAFKTVPTKIGGLYHQTRVKGSLPPAKSKVHTQKG